MKRDKAWIRAVPWKTSTGDKVKGALGEIPAYVRRAKRTEDAIERLFAAAKAEREERLLFVCLRLRQYLDVLGPDGEPDATIREILNEVTDLETFRRLRPRPLRRRASVDSSRAALRESVLRFNGNWQAWITTEAPLAAANREIEGYNRHFPMERQAALKYVPADEVRFEKKVPLDEGDLLSACPLLPVP